MENNQALIEIEGLTKVFYTDEIETHALSGVHMKIDKGEYVAISRPAAASQRCFPSSASSTRPPAAATH